MLKLYNFLKKWHKQLLFLCDFIIWNLSYYLSFTIIRYTFTIKGYEEVFFKTLIVLNVCFIASVLIFRLYDSIWRYADIEDFFYACLASLIANVCFWVITVLMGCALGGRTHVLLTLMSTFLMLAFRFLYRINRLVELRNIGNKPKKRILIVGAGEAAVTILHEIGKTPSNEYVPICMVDDDKEKVGRRISGVRVLGSTQQIPMLCEKYDIELILFSISNISSSNRRRILDICAKTNLEVRIIPRIYDLVTANFPMSSKIRRVDVEDLLGRDPIVFDTEKFGSYLKGQTVLVTGGGGSIGSEICRQVAKLPPKKLIILDIYENNAYNIQQELKRNHPDLNFEVQIASVRDKEKLEELFKYEHINVVFHAAAHKHVPLMEHNPEEAVKNNVFGTLNMVRLADKYHIKRFVMISTDKAVNPTSVMGTTKRICEMIVQSMDKASETEFVAVRFGNVLGSNGSVIPLFKQQIKEGGPVTVTHPEIIRYFMAIPEAVSLVLTAGGLAHGGEIFVLDMGEPVKIKDLAENLIRLSGFRPGKDIEIKYTGLRPGEKLYEELLLDEEGIQKTNSEKIYIGKPLEINISLFNRYLAELHELAEKNDQEAILQMLHTIVPTFHHELNNHQELPLQKAEKQA